MRSYNLGILAEYFVLMSYLVRFYQPLRHRYRSYAGEIDLIVKRGRTLVFIEVKARKYGLAEGTISTHQQQRIARSAEFFIAKHPQYNLYNMRFDLAVVKPFSLPLIIKGAW